jgi:hypothetical protein
LLYQIKQNINEKKKLNKIFKRNNFKVTIEKKKIISNIQKELKQLNVIKN